jgi:hypothetical protein
MNSIFKTALAASIAYTTHFGVVKVYNEMCVPDGFWGFFQGAITTGSPICNGLFTVMSQSQVSYNAIILTSLSYLFVDGLQAILSSGKNKESAQEQTTEETYEQPKARRR